MIGPVVLDWYAADLGTGDILEDLKSFAPSDVVGRRLGQSVTVNGALVPGTVGPGWIDATVPGRSMLVAVDSLAQEPIWAGIVLTRARGSASTVPFGLATPECYFDRRYTGSYDTEVPTDQALILTGTGSALAVDSPCFTFDAPASGETLDSYTVADSDDRTILSVWEDLMGAEGGVEWTVDVEWADDTHTGFVLPIRIRPQVGDQSAMPGVALDFPGNVTSYVQTESYEAGKGATTILAYGNGQGEARLQSAVYRADDLIALGWPEWVYRFTPAAGLDDVVQLNSHAAAALAQMRTGSSVWTVTAVASRTDHVGVDWGVGDTMRLTVRSSPGHPDGVDLVIRNYGWDLNVSGGSDTVTPILIEGD